MARSEDGEFAPSLSWILFLVKNIIVVVVLSCIFLMLSLSHIINVIIVVLHIVILFYGPVFLHLWYILIFLCWYFFAFCDNAQCCQNWLLASWAIHHHCFISLPLQSKPDFWAKKAIWAKKSLILWTEQIPKSLKRGKMPKSSKILHVYMNMIENFKVLKDTQKL